MFDWRAERAHNAIHYLLLRRGVVPHETTDDIDANRSGFALLRLRKRPRRKLRALKDARQIASCNTSAERSEAREDGIGRNAASRVASPLVMATRGIEARFNNVRLARHACSRPKPLPPASQGVVPHETIGYTYANRSGFAPLRLRQRPFGPQVASAHHSCGRRCGGSLWRYPRQSEQKRRTRTRGLPRRKLRALTRPSPTSRGCAACRRPCRA